MSGNKKMTLCKVCGKEIAKNARTCPFCGAKNKKPVFKRWWFILLIIIIILIVIVSAGSGSQNAETEKAKKMNKTTFMSSCKKYDYKELKRNSEKYEGKHIKLKLWVEQAVDDTTFRAYSKAKYDDNDSSWTGNEYVLEDRRDEKNPKMVEEDIVTIYGVYNGTETMNRVIGGSDEIPSIDVVYVKIENKK